MRKTFVQMMKYSSVGIVNTIIGVSVIFLCMEIFHLSYIISNIIGYAAGLINSFIWNKFWTFRSSGNTGSEILRFIIVFAIAYIIQLGALILMKERIGIMSEIAQVLGVGVYAATGFILNKYLTFNK